MSASTSQENLKCASKRVLYKKKKKKQAEGIDANGAKHVQKEP